MKRKLDYSLYLVTDRSFLNGRRLEDVVLSAIQGGVTLVQLREKNVESRELFELARALKSLLDSQKVPLIINDRLDIAMAVGADGVHLGQTDLPCQEARRLMGQDAIIGVSVENTLQAHEAERVGADYLGAGPVFQTGTKLDAGPAIGVQGLKQICLASKLPVVAIGGISLENVSSLRGSGLSGIAAVSAIMGANDPKKASAGLRSGFT